MTCSRSIMGDQRGAVAILAAFMLVPLIAFIGGAVDLVRASLLEVKLQSALDNAALSAASLTNDQPLDVVLDEYVTANLGDDRDQIDGLELLPDPEVSSNSKQITIRAQGTIPTFFLGVVGVETLPVGATVTALQGRDSIEIALVLDISWSMKGQKQTALEEAAVAFVEQMLAGEAKDTTTINLIPYGGSVNLSTLFDQYAVSLDDPDVHLDPNTSAYTDADFAHDKFRFTGGSACIEYADDDFDDDVLPAKSRSQIPVFTGSGSETWCPEGTSRLLLNSSDPDALSTAIKGFTLSAGTATDIGVSWAYRALSPKWRGLVGGDAVDRPADFDDESILKVVVLMSDGGTTAQRRPLDPSTGSIRTVNNGVKNVQTKRKAKDSRDLMVSICEDIKSENVIIFTIGFQIETGTFQESNLQDCASSLGHYFLVEDLDLASAFESITSSIGTLRLTQ